jgi:hypothetical protein
MANAEFDDFEGDYVAHSGQGSRLVNMAGAVCSIALIVGLGVWGYKLAVRDVSGIPVVRALEGPLRMSPDNPGGAVTMHQGLSVNAVAASGIAMPLPESLTLAPKSTELVAEDEAGLAVLAALPEAGAEVMAEVTLASADLPAADLPAVDLPAADLPAIDTPVEIAAQPAEVLPATQEDAVAAALAMALSDGGEPFTALDVVPGVESAAMDLVPVTLVKSLRPKARPAAAEVAVVQDVAAIAPLEMDASAIVAGTRLVQLGAFDDEAGARGEWAKLQGRFAELIAGKAMVVQAAQSGGRTFYRLRAHGFEGEDEARRFCAALLAENASCIPVSQR